MSVTTKTLDPESCIYFRVFFVIQFEEDFVQKLPTYIPQNKQHINTERKDLVYWFWTHGKFVTRMLWIVNIKDLDQNQYNLCSIENLSRSV